MCVHCYVEHDTTYRHSTAWCGLVITSFLGGWRNFRPRKHRGEGYPAPWLIVTAKNRRFGFEVDANPYLFFRRLRWEPKTGYASVGPLILAWRPKVRLTTP